jgi:hypothetical protein
VLIGEMFRVLGSFEHHWVDFEAEADWNLRDDWAHPKSFQQEADGDGTVLALVGRYDLSARWVVDLTLEYQDWKAEDGKISFFTNEGLKIQQLNEVNWESRTAMLGLTYRFF